MWNLLSFIRPNLGRADCVSLDWATRPAGFPPEVEVGPLTRRMAFYLAALAVCLVLCWLLLYRLPGRAAPTVLIDLPYPGEASQSGPAPSLFESAGPAAPEVIRILSENPPRAELRDGHGHRVWVRTGDTLDGGSIVAITSDAVVWELSGKTSLLKVSPGSRP